MAGLCCARKLQEARIPFLLLESEEAIGGRVRTDEVDGYRLNRGFQVLQTEYPEVQSQLDLKGLRLGNFYPGMLIRYNGKFHRMSNPQRKPFAALWDFFSPIGSMADKLLLRKLRNELAKGEIDTLLQAPERTTLERLERYGFSQTMITLFFRPLLSSMLLENELVTSSRLFDFIFRMITQGETALPAGGMDAIPGQLASRIPPEKIRLGRRVVSLEGQTLALANGEIVTAPYIVLAVEESQAFRLLGLNQPPPERKVTTLYFSATTPPIAKPFLMLNGEGQGPTLNCCVPSQVAPGYAPQGRALISCSVLGSPMQSDAELALQVKDQMQGWFGPQVSDWHHLRTYRILNALPEQMPPALSKPVRPVRYQPGIYWCGDHRSIASIHGAMLTGRLAAEAVLEDRGKIHPRDLVEPRPQQGKTIAATPPAG